MKKVFLAIITFNIIWLIMPIMVSAMSKDDIKSVLETNYTFTNGISQTSIDTIYNFWESNQSFYMVTKQSNSSYVNVFICGSYVYDTALRVSNYYQFDVYISDGRLGSSNPTLKSGPTAQGPGDYTVNEWTDSSIDFSWTNVSYDSSIPTPSIDVDLSSNTNEKYFSNPNYSDSPMYGQLGPEIPYYIGIKGSQAYDGFYLYLDMTIWTPTSGQLDLENGIYKFTPKALVKTDDIAYFSWEDMKTAPTTSNLYYQTNAPLTGSTILIDQQENLNTWYNIRRHIEEGTNDYQEMSYTTTLTGSAKDTGISRINQMLRNASLAGNRVRFRACLYYINENNEIKCGNFATWTSAQPSSPTSEQPSTNAQVVDQPASGISQTVSYDNVVSQNESTSDIPPVNVTTGGANINVTVNTGEQNVPNNQNYPTVVSYNHDNIFTTFIGTYNNASQYLGGFAQFCNSCLLWIPSEIWSIIGMGFAMALVIMIVKIL